MLSPKELMKLASACRKAGIKHYKTADFEFTLTDDVPAKIIKGQVQSIQPSTIETDSLTQDQLMMWSAMDPTSESNI